MGIFDKLMNDVLSTAEKNVNVFRSERETFTFHALPESLAQLQSLPEADLSNPFKTAVLSLCALCAYAADKQIGIEMLNWLKGPSPLSNQEISFIDDRFRDGKTYIPFSYFDGAVPDNNYSPIGKFSMTNHLKNRWFRPSNSSKQFFIFSFSIKFLHKNIINIILFMPI